MHSTSLSLFSDIVKGTFLHPETGTPCRHFFIAAHTSPDGDAIGSILAFAHLVTHFGGHVRLYLPEGMPKDFAWLSCPWPLVASLDELDGFVPDVLAFFDCGDGRRAGEELAEVLEKKALPGCDGFFPVTLNVDHHKGNPQFADYNWVEPECAATGELVGEIAEYAGLTLQGSLGEAVYLALIADTGRFTFPNTSAKTLAMASRIVGNGLNLAEFTRKREYTWSLARMHMWGFLLQNITLHHGGSIVSCVVPQDIFIQFNTDKSDLEDFADMLKRLHNVAVVLFIREEKNGGSKISLRSVSGIDVRRVAVLFGGGGHAAAAGANTPEAPAVVLEQILAKLIELWDAGD